MSLVLDASLTLSWFFKDERTRGADAILTMTGMQRREEESIRLGVFTEPGPKTESPVTATARGSNHNNPDGQRQSLERLFGWGPGNLIELRVAVKLPVDPAAAPLDPRLSGRFASKPLHYCILHTQISGQYKISSVRDASSISKTNEHDGDSVGAIFENNWIIPIFNNFGTNHYPAAHALRLTIFLSRISWYMALRTDL